MYSITTDDQNLRAILCSPREREALTMHSNRYTWICFSQRILDFMHDWFTSVALKSWRHSPLSWASWFFNLVMSGECHLSNPELRLDYELGAPMKS